MCRRSCRPGRGSSRPGRDARPTPPTPTPWRWSGPGWLGCGRWSTTSSSRCCGSWSTGAGRWARTTPAMVAQLHHLLLELIPGGAKKDLSAAQAKALLAKVRPRDVAGKTRRRVAAELIARPGADLPRKKAADKELTELVAATGTTLTGPAPASDPPVRPGCWSRSATSPASPTATTSRPGTAPHRSTPPPATRSGTGCRGPGTVRSTGPCTSWPPSSCATRPRAAPTTTARKADGKTSMEAMRCTETATVRTSSTRPCSTTRSPRRRRKDGPGRATGQRL